MILAPHGGIAVAAPQATPQEPDRHLTSPSAPEEVGRRGYCSGWMWNGGCDPRGRGRAKGFRQTQWPRAAAFSNSLLREPSTGSNSDTGWSRVSEICLSIRLTGEHLKIQIPGYRDLDSIDVRGAQECTFHGTAGTSDAEPGLRTWGWSNPFTKQSRKPHLSSGKSYRCEAAA